jgi:hypothetical protein
VAFAVVARRPLSNEDVLWHVEQSAVVGGWSRGLLRTPVNCPSWQLEQLVEMPE